MADFDVIVVGAGVCGSAAAMKAASNGLNVLLVDRAKPIGSKNLSGGVLWGHDLKEVYPDWWKDGLAEGALERPITRKGVNMLTNDSMFTAQFGTEEWKKEPYNGFAVLRARLDKWLAEKAEQMGAMVVDGVNVDRIVTEEHHGVVKATGIEQAGETISADCVILADGCNSRLGMEMGLRGKLSRHYYVLGVKEVIQLPEETIQERFNIGPDEGVAHEYVLGYLENGAKAGGFLYTNKDTISLGVVINLDSIWEKGIYTHRIMEEFRLHPEIKPLLKDGELVEYGAHLIPEGGLNCIPQLSGDGWMVAGDAAGFVYSNGLVIHGMNYAIKSGLCAGQAAVEAKKAGDWSAQQLSRYDELIHDSYILQDFQKFNEMHEFVWDENMHRTIPSLVDGVFKDLFTASGEPKKKTKEIVKDNLKGKSKWSLMRTMMKGSRSV